MNPARFTALLVAYYGPPKPGGKREKLISLDEPPENALDGASLYEMFNGGA